MEAVTMNGLWTMLQTLGLSPSNKQWLVDKLMADIAISRSAENAQSHKAFIQSLTPDVQQLVGILKEADKSDLNGDNYREVALNEKYDL